VPWISTRSSWAGLSAASRRAGDGAGRGAGGVAAGAGDVVVAGVVAGGAGGAGGADWDQAGALRPSIKATESGRGAGRRELVIGQASARQARPIWRWLGRKRGEFV
jgi:hypothetical protein